MLKKILLSVFSLIGFIGFAHGQSQFLGQDTARRPIITAVPFLTIAPDARAAGMGDAGGALSADANATYWNAAKLAFIETNVGGSLSFTPWLAKLVDDMYIFYGSGYKKLSDTEAIGASLRYFDLGDITFTDGPRWSILREGKPREFSLDFSYSRILSKTNTKGFGMGVTGRFIHSNLTDGVAGGNGNTARPGNTAAVDLGAFYENKGLVGWRISFHSENGRTNFQCGYQNLLLR